MSNADKRSVATDALATLGTIIGENEKRDAIHLAVEPVTAGEALRPGADVYLAHGLAWSTGDGKRVGIVDPFLKEWVQQGERFWLVVYPRQITSLRHVWEHPDIPASGETTLAKDVVAAPSEVSRSEQWIREFAARIPLHYDVVMDGARNWVESQRRGGWGDYLNFGPLLEGERVPEEFWEHYENVTGERVQENHRGSFFTCSCN